MAIDFFGGDHDSEPWGRQFTYRKLSLHQRGSFGLPVPARQNRRKGRSSSSFYPTKIYVDIKFGMSKNLVNSMDEKLVVKRLRELRLSKRLL